MTNYNIIRISHASSTRSFQIADANHKPEKIALKAIEKVFNTDEANKLVKFYRRSVITNESLIEDLYRHNGEPVAHCKLESYNTALKSLHSLLSDKEKLKTIHFTGVRMYDHNFAGSAELPYVNDSEFIQYVHSRYNNGEIQTPALTKGNGWNMILEKERVKIHQIKDGMFPHVKMIHDTRMHGRSHLTHEGKDDKVRAVYGVCCTIILVEVMLLWPLINRIKKQSNPFIAWGYETFRGGLQRLREETTNAEIHISADSSSFDKLLPFWLFDDIHALWKSLYDLGPYYEDDPNYPDPSTDPVRIERLWQFMNFATKYTPFRAPDGSRYKRKHSGLASGQLQTQLLGSCCNYIMLFTAMLEAGFTSSDFSIKVMGDDSCLSIFTPVADPTSLISNLARIVNTIFNAKINTEKTVFSIGSSTLQFLSYKFEGGAIRRVNLDLLGKLIYPEKAHFSVESTKSRALGILISNLGYDPLVHAVCSDILEFLSKEEYKTSDLDWYKRKKLEHILSIFERYPTRTELFKVALTPQPYVGDSNWDKFIR